jgi:hypothetical protein
MPYFKDLGWEPSQARGDSRGSSFKEGRLKRRGGRRRSLQDRGQLGEQDLR